MRGGRNDAQFQSHKSRIVSSPILDVNLDDLTASLGPADELHSSRSVDSNISSSSYYANLLRPIKLRAPTVSTGIKTLGTYTASASRVSGPKGTSTFPESDKATTELALSETVLEEDGEDDAQGAPTAHLNDSCFSLQSFGPPAATDDSQQSDNSNTQTTIQGSIPYCDLWAKPVATSHLVVPQPRKTNTFLSLAIPYDLYGMSLLLPSGRMGVDRRGSFYYTFHAKHRGSDGSPIKEYEQCDRPSWLSPSGLPPPRRECTTGVVLMRDGDARIDVVPTSWSTSNDDCSPRARYTIVEWTPYSLLAREYQRRYHYGLYLLEVFKASTVRWTLRPCGEWVFRRTHSTEVLPDLILGTHMQRPHVPFPRRAWSFWATMTRTFRSPVHLFISDDETLRVSTCPTREYMMTDLSVMLRENGEADFRAFLLASIEAFQRSLAVWLHAETRLAEAVLTALSETVISVTHPDDWVAAVKRLQSEAAQAMTTWRSVADQDIIDACRVFM